ncbi:protein YgfX [Pseudoduganella sp. UC29_71]|jgi:toxin CptA|uniref:protein YgfX n=1 Tax=Pseudoduganella sp. UC29_71 TaxID=3350174 RepID=UPI0036730D9C
MSIAVSAVVRPSFCLRVLLAGFAACALAVAVWLPPILAISCAAASATALRCALRRAKTHRLDISGIGQMRLAVYLHAALRTAGAAVQAAEAAPATVELMAGSTCWPWLLLLRLRHEGGAVTVLAVLPDSVAPGRFRPLALACRACAAKKL